MTAKAELRESDRRCRARILLVEHGAGFADLVGRNLDALTWCDLSLERVQTLCDAVSRLARGDIDLVFAAPNLPDSKGIGTLQRLVHASEVPIVVVTGAEDRLQRDAAIGSGAYDVVNRDQLDGLGLERLVRLTCLQTSALRSLRESERRTRQILDTAPDALVAMDAAGGIRDWNPRAEQLFGWSRSEVIGRSLAETIIPPRYRQGHLQGLEHFLATGEGPVLNKTIEMPALCRDGREIPVELSVLAVGSGDNLLFTAFLHDLSNRKLAEQALALKSEVLRGTLEHMDQGISMVDAELRMVAWNRRFLELLDFPESLFNENTTFEDVIRFNAGRGEYGPGDVEEQVRRRVELARRFEPHLFERTRPDGTILEIRGKPLPGGGFVTTYTDVTAQRRAEHLLRLEHSVTRAFAETANAADALKGALQAMCEAGQWECGRYLRVDSAAGVLRFGEAWGVQDADVQRYIEESRRMAYARGVGLVGAVWESQEPLWVPDIADDPRTARPWLARVAGVRAAMVVPVSGGGKPIGVLIFHSRRVREPDARLLETIRTIGGQIGQHAQRAQAEQALREREAQLSLINDAVPAMIVYYDRDFRLRYANRQHVEFYGYALGEALGKHAREVLGAESWTQVRPYFERALVGESVSYERAVTRPGTGLAHIDVHVIPHRAESGSVVGFYGLVTDITEKKRAEELLRSQTEELRTAQILAKTLSIEWDAAADRLSWSRAPDWLLGPRPASGEYPPFKDMVHPEDRAAFLDDRDAALRGEREHQIEYRIVRTDGEQRWVSARGTAFRDASGRVARMAIVLQDVTERKRSDEALRLRNRALEASVSSILITEPTDEGQRIVYVNPAFERITGYSAPEVLGRDPRFLYGDDRHQAGVEALETAWHERREVTALVRTYRKDGTPFWNELHVAPVQDEAARVTHFVGVGDDVTERIRHQETIEQQANYDTLTGLPNRSLLSDRLAQAVVKAARSGRPLGVMFVDLDHLKRINDSLGHAIGDQVIAAVGRRMAGTLRTGDTVARVSGDEFVVLLTDIQHEDDVAPVAAKVRNSIGSPLKIEAHEFVLSASIGIALYPKDGADAPTLLRNADAALYRAKEHGRDCFRFFAPDMNERMVRYLAVERALRQALEAEEFRLEYQPIVRLATGEAVGAEALTRWRRPDGSMVAPAEFIPIAEESGLIVPIGRWVFETAARQAGLWNRGRKPFFVSVNVSARQFRDPGLLDSIRSAIQSARVNPALIKVEITESTLMQSPEGAVKTLRALQELGVRLVMDDFGTGYSSLAYLKRFPIDTLKIDRSFVRGLLGDAEDLALTRAVIDLARGLGLDVVAEGVETREQARLLTEQRCPFAQGYLFGHPQDAAKLSVRRRARSRRRRSA